MVRHSVFSLFCQLPLIIILADAASLNVDIKSGIFSKLTASSIPDGWYTFLWELIGMVIACGKMQICIWPS